MGMCEKNHQFKIKRTETEARKYDRFKESKSKLSILALTKLTHSPILNK